MEPKPRVVRLAVVGLGISGIAALKNFREEGFDAIGFERNSYVGGLWRFTDDKNQTTVLESTQTNGSRFRHTYTDFQFPLDWPDFPSGAQIDQYIQDYVDHFNLREYFRLESSINLIERSEDGKQWALRVIDAGNETRTEFFDKVFITVGAHGQAFVPKIEGLEIFQGKIIHSQGFKDPKEFTEKIVLAVGLSNTGGDITVELSKTARQVYISHQLGAYISPRYDTKGKPVDQLATRRVGQIIGLLSKIAPVLSRKFGAKVLELKMKKTYNTLRPEWRLLPAPPVPNSTPIVNDHIVDLLASARVLSAPGIKKFTGPSTIEMADGTTLEVDAVIFCTGYRYSFDLLADEVKPTRYPSPKFDQSSNANGMHHARLFMGIFSTDYPDSLGFYGPYRGPTFSGFTNGDLVSQAVAQLWKGNSPLPSKAEIEDWCDNQYRFDCEMLSVHRVTKPMLPPGELERWLNEAAGNAVNQKLGWGLEGWKFWWTDRQLYYTIMDGFDTGYLYRLFDGRRKKWDGAKVAIERSNGKS